MHNKRSQQFLVITVRSISQKVVRIIPAQIHIKFHLSILLLQKLHVTNIQVKIPP